MQNNEASGMLFLCKLLAVRAKICYNINEWCAPFDNYVNQRGVSDESGCNKACGINRQGHRREK